MLVAAHVRIPAAVFLAPAIGGAAWMAFIATFSTATQTSAPPCVRSRPVALHTVSALGAFTIGSAFWGAVSGIAGLPVSLSMAAVAVIAGMFLGRWLPLRVGELQEVTPGVQWGEPLIK
ncbi:MAG: arabinose ABC transporter permease, partial [Alcaligenaceae bacterium]